jgi:hypothetical protein
VHDHRQLALAQLVFEKELGLTPLAFAALRGSQQPPLDLVGMMAAQSDAAETTAAWSPVRIDSLLEQSGFELPRPSSRPSCGGQPHFHCFGASGTGAGSRNHR